jgi:3-phosphoshikimate 1-carboxyvinyltransferase
MSNRRVRYVAQVNQQSPLQIKLLGSKYIANRLVVIAALSKTPTTLYNVPDNNDINVAIAGLNALGAKLIREGDRVICNTPITVDSVPTHANLYCGASGTFSRFITAVAAGLVNESITISADDKMSTRPMNDLVEALSSMGASIIDAGGKLPLSIHTKPVNNTVSVKGNISSQYISGLLLAAPLSNHGLTIHLIGEVVSRSYIQLTMDLMAKAGVKVEWQGQSLYIAPNQSYCLGEFYIPPDPVSASYFMGLGLLTRQSVTIRHFDPSICQGETNFYKVLEAMGADVKISESGLTIHAPMQLSGGEFDMGDMPDVVQTLCMLATIAKTPVIMSHIAHLAFKESNRIEDTATEMRKLNINVDTAADQMTVYPADYLIPATLDSHDDHRMAMSLALLASRGIEVIINDADVVNKSFPVYWDMMKEVGLVSAEVSDLESNIIANDSKEQQEYN